MEYTPINKDRTSIVDDARASSDTQIRPKIYRSRSLGTVLWQWKWGFATWLLGTAALGSIIMLLITFGDKPLDNWTPSISLATFIAVFSQIAQSALLFSVSSCIGQLKWSWLRTERKAIDIKRFDEASRGPKGSFSLLFTTRSHLVSIGALATILLLGFASFAQQSNTISIRTIDADLSVAIIGRSVRYFSNTGNADFYDRGATTAVSDPSTVQYMYRSNMFRGIVTGLNGHNVALSDVTGTCQAKMCDWEPYTTLAVCTSIEDVSSDGVISNSKHGENFTLAGVPWKPVLQNLSVPDTFWMASAIQQNKSLEEMRGHIVDIYVAYYPPCDDQGNSRLDWRADLDNATNWRAYRATVDVCVQTLKSRFNGTMETIVMETKSGIDWTINCDDQNTTSSEFCVNYEDLHAWTSQISKAFTGSASLYMEGDNYFTGQWIPNVVTDILGDIPSKCDPASYPIPGLDGFIKRMNNIANSMSNAMRTDQSASSVNGTQKNTQQYIAVTYYWLAFPVSIYICITLFLFSTVIASLRHGTPIWKSSPLVLLQAMGRSNGLQGLNQAEKEAENMQLQLQFTGENWHLQDVTQRRLGIHQS